jgi:eukaryotic-like serine/threonine-protein kinase
VSLIRTVTAGALVGSVAALGIFVSVGPDDMGRAAAPAAPTFAPVPTPTVTELADCTPPAKLKKGVCVTTEVVTRTAAVVSSGAPTSAGRTTPPRTTPTRAPSPTASDPVAVDPRPTPSRRHSPPPEDD